MAEINLDVRTRWIKYALLCITTLLVLSSAFIIIVGTTINRIYHDIVFFLDNNFFNEAIFTIIIGLIILFVSLLGFIGALKEKTCLVKWFATSLIIVLVLELYAAITAFNMREQVDYMLADSMRMFFPDYYRHHKVQAAFDLMQRGLHCCGIESYMDWNNVPPPMEDTGFVFGNVTVPQSCCQATSTNFYNVEECEVLNTKGCLIMVDYLAYNTAIKLGAAALTVAFIQIIGIVVSWFSLAKSIRREMSERERKRCEMQEQLINHYTSIDPKHENKKPYVYRLFSIGPFSLVCTKDLV